MACHQQTGDNDKHEQKKKNDIIKYNHDETAGAIQQHSRIEMKCLAQVIPINVSAHAFRQFQGSYPHVRGTWHHEVVIH